MTRNIAASVHRRLLNQARAQGRPFDELLQYFALERFLYRLGRSPYVANFVLKGALMFNVWQGASARSTRDVDLLGHLDSQVASVVQAMRAVCQEESPEDDGLRFDEATVSGTSITEAAQYQGVRVRLSATLGQARIRLQVDVGFGDILIPGPTWVQLPIILDNFPPPVLQGYSRESVIAEKFQAIVYLGMLNSRMKDFYDIWSLAMQFNFDGPLLASALRETFRQRQTPLQEMPVAFTPAFTTDPDKQVQWRAFVRRLPQDPAPPTLEVAVRGVAALLQPIVQAMVQGQDFEQRWQPSGPWSTDVTLPLE